MSDESPNIGDFPPLQPRDILSPAATLLGFVIASLTYIIGVVENQSDLGRFITFLILAVILLVMAAMLTVLSNLFQKEVLWRISMALYTASWLFFGIIIIIVLGQSIGVDPFKIQIPQVNVQYIVAIFSTTVGIIGTIIGYYYGRRVFQKDLQLASLKFENTMLEERERISETIHNIVLEEIEDKEMSFVKIAIELEKKVREIAEQTHIELPYPVSRRPISIIEILSALEKLLILNKDFTSTFRSIWKVRNAIVHGRRVEKENLNMAIDLAATLLLELENKKVSLT